MDYSGCLAFHFAARVGHVEMVKLFLDHGLDSHIKDSAGFTALCWAAAGSREGVVELLLAEEIDLNRYGLNGNGVTALDLAVSSGSLRIVQLLIDGNVDPNLFGHYYGCPLQTAVVNSRTDIVQLLLCAGAKHYVDEHGWSPALCAREFKVPQMLEILPTASIKVPISADFPQPSSWSDKHKLSRLTLANGDLDVIYDTGIDY
jgi:ankyrin repeat protein